jgi:prepilin-type N-terminal cleavage/methylation domain-containing protein
MSPLRIRGFTLAEVLLASAVAGVLLLSAAAMVAATRRSSDRIDARVLAAERSHAIPELLHGALARAGERGTPCQVAVSADGLHLTLHAGSERHELFAARDADRRPALYARTAPHARQPWLEGVTHFEVVAARASADTWTLPASGTPVVALRLSLGWSDGDDRRYDLPLPHAPCLWQRG